MCLVFDPNETMVFQANLLYVNVKDQMVECHFCSIYDTDVHCTLSAYQEDLPDFSYSYYELLLKIIHNKLLTCKEVNVELVQKITNKYCEKILAVMEGI